jgi:hypothetical protein
VPSRAQPCGERLRGRAVRLRSHSNAIQLAAIGRASRYRCDEIPRPKLTREMLGVLATRKAAHLNRPAGHRPGRLRMRVRMRCATGGCRRRGGRGHVARDARRCRSRRRQWTRRRRHAVRGRRRRARRDGRRHARRGGRRTRIRCRGLRNRRTALARPIRQIDRERALRRLVGGARRPLLRAVRPRQQLRHEQDDQSDKDHRTGQSLFNSYFHLGAKIERSSQLEDCAMRGEPPFSIAQATRAPIQR